MLISDCHPLALCQAFRPLHHRRSCDSIASKMAMAAMIRFKLNELMPWDIMRHHETSGEGSAHKSHVLRITWIDANHGCTRLRQTHAPVRLQFYTAYYQSKTKDAKENYLTKLRKFKFVYDCCWHGKKCCRAWLVFCTANEAAKGSTESRCSSAFGASALPIPILLWAPRGLSVVSRRSSRVACKMASNEALTVGLQACFKALSFRTIPDSCAAEKRSICFSWNTSFLMFLDW